MIRNPKAGCTTLQHGEKRPPRPGCEGGSWNGVYVLLAISALALSGYGFAQENKGSPDGLYAIPDAGENADAAKESTANRSAQSYLSSLDAQGEKYKHDMAEAEALNKAMVASKKAKYLAERSGGFDWSAWRPHLSERAWIAIWAGLGILVSAAAGGYLWWSRVQNSKSNSAVLLAVTREPATRPDGTGKQDKPAKRRAA